MCQMGQIVRHETRGLVPPSPICGFGCRHEQKQDDGCNGLPPLVRQQRKIHRILMNILLQQMKIHRVLRTLATTTYFITTGTYGFPSFVKQQMK